MKKIFATTLKILFITVIAIFLLICLDLAISGYIKSPSNKQDDKNSWDLPWQINQGLLAYQFRPNYKGQQWGSLVSINSFGFRGKNFNLIKPPNTIRILCLGDSTTFGVGGLDNEDTYPFLLEKILNESKNLNNFEVINAGMPGSTVYEGYILLKQRNLMQLKPDIVIICYGWNDHMRAETGNVLTAYKRFFNNLLNNRFLCWRYLNNRFLYYWRYLSAKFKNGYKKNTCSSNKRRLKINESEYKRYLSGIINLARSANAKVLIITAPWEPRLMHENIGWVKESTEESFYLHPAYVNLTKEVGKRQRIKLVDLYSIFESKKTSNPCVFFNDPFHYNKSGAELIVSYVSKAIIEILQIEK